MVLFGGEEHAYSSCRGSKFVSQHPHEATGNLPLTPALGDSLPSSDLSKYCTHGSVGTSSCPQPHSLRSPISVSLCLLTPNSWQVIQLPPLMLPLKAPWVPCFWSYLATNPGCGRHIIIPCLQSIKFPCLGSGRWLLWPLSLGQWTHSGGDFLNNPAVILFQFGLVWLTAPAEKLIIRWQKT